MNNKPLISIITIVYNDVEHIEATIQSVIHQTYDQLEYIIIDGGSNDGTLEIIEKYATYFKYWVSEKDSGISDAFNKGIAYSAENSYIQLLNSGDILSSPSILSEIAAYLNSDLVSFRTLSKSGRFIGYLEYLTQKDYARLPHQSTFVKKELYQVYGGYSMGYKIRMDYEFFSKLSFFVKPKMESHVVVIFDNTGISSSLKHKFRFEIEGIIIEYLYFNRSIFRVLHLPAWRTLKSALGVMLRKLGLRK